jgi:hypothetical protein
LIHHLGDQLAAQHVRIVEVWHIGRLVILWLLLGGGCVRLGDRRVALRRAFGYT